jgi:hypothetical protein
MEQIHKYRKFFLFSALVLLSISFIIKWLEMSAWCFWILLSTAILLKILFLIAVFSTKGFKPGLWLYFILAGVALILISMLFKTIFPVPILHKILFYGAISLKIIGLILMLFFKKEKVVIPTTNLHC